MYVFMREYGKIVCLVLVLITILFFIPAPQRYSSLVTDNIVRQSDKAIIAVVNGEIFRIEDIESRLNLLPEWAKARYSDVSERQAWLNTLVEFELLADEAESLGYGNHSYVIEELEKLKSSQSNSM